MVDLTRFDLVHDRIYVYLYSGRTGIPDFHLTEDKLLERVAILKFLDAVDDEILMQYLQSRKLPVPTPPEPARVVGRRLVRKR